METKKALLLTAGLLLAGFGVNSALKASRNKGLVEGCNIVAANTLSNPLFQGTCEMYKGKLTVVLTALTGAKVRLDAVTGEQLELIKADGTVVEAPKDGQ